jgi:hypothetical protein
VALARTGLGDLDGAFDALDAACDERDPAIADIGVDPRLAPLRVARRYRALTDRLRVAAEMD